MKIWHTDTAFCRTDQPKILRVKELSYLASFWKKNLYHKQEISYDSYLIDTKGFFLAGLLPRVLTYCKKNNISIDIDLFEIDIPVSPITSTIQLRPDQQVLVKKALQNHRGVIKSPTGSGKTVIAAAIMSAFPTRRILFLCHTISLLQQTKEELDRFKVGPASIVYGSKKDFSGRIIISTVQSFSKNPIIEKMSNEFDIIIVDEAHHVSSLGKGAYYKVLTSIIAPIRYGITATLQDAPESQFALEGLIGPVVGEISLEDGIKNDLLAIPKIHLIIVPQAENLNSIRGYQNIYQYAIVEYRRRNRIIIEEAKKLNSEGKSVLIYVNKIEHGERLLDIAERMKFPALFVRGETEGPDREAARQALNNKHIMTIISTSVWKEGVNIRSLDCVIIAGGGKKELVVLQEIGRALRKTEHKSNVTLVDLIDHGRYLSDHSVARLAVYCENGWLQ